MELDESSEFWFSDTSIREQEAFLIADVDGVFDLGVSLIVNDVEILLYREELRRVLNHLDTEAAERFMNGLEAI